MNREAVREKIKAILAEGGDAGYRAFHAALILMQAMAAGTLTPDEAWAVMDNVALYLASVSRFKVKRYEEATGRSVARPFDIL